MYCQACRLFLPLTVAPSLDPITGPVQQHRCGKCDRPVGYIKWSPEELGVAQ